MNNLLLSAVASATLITSPLPSPSPKSPSALMGMGVSSVPSLTASVVNISNNISCRSKARAKYFELGARDMSNSEDNGQWGTVGNMQALVWCRDTQAIIVVGGQSTNSINELRDEIKKAF